MKKLKEIYNKVKEGLENPRLRAIIILCMYAVFFFLVFVLLNAGSKTSTNSNKEKDNNTNQISNVTHYNNISDNYSYSCTIEYNENDNITKYLLEGKYSTIEKSELVQKYNKETDDYSIVEKPTFINDDFILLNKVISYVNDKEYEFSTSYKDGSSLKNYKVKLSDINEIYSNVKNIEINIYEFNDNIIKVVVESTEYDKIENENIKNVLYTIEYKNLK